MPRGRLSAAHGLSVPLAGFPGAAGDLALLLAAIWPRPEKPGLPGIVAILTYSPPPGRPIAAGIPGPLSHSYGPRNTDRNPKAIGMNRMRMTTPSDAAMLVPP